MYGLGLFVAALASPQAGAAPRASPEAFGSVPRSSAGALASAIGAVVASAVGGLHADFRGEPRSNEVSVIADWVARSGDNGRMPFVIIDKVAAKVFVFDRLGRLSGTAPALLGLARGDDSVPGIGQRRLATMKPEERTTPAGRFVAGLGHDLEQDVLWIDYDAAVSLHRAIVGRPEEARSKRLASASALDNRISYGCINVRSEFYDAVVKPAFEGTAGIVYVLPEVRALGEVFAMVERARIVAVPKGTARYPRLDDSRLPDR
jgi:hypothetical protein